MNALLVSGMRMLNGLVAFIIVAAGAVVGYGMLQGAAGLVVGLIAGFLTAVLVNGSIAALVEIERHLRELKERVVLTGSQSAVQR